MQVEDRAKFPLGGAKIAELSGQHAGDRGGADLVVGELSRIQLPREVLALLADEKGQLLAILGQQDAVARGPDGRHHLGVVVLDPLHGIHFLARQIAELAALAGVDILAREERVGQQGALQLGAFALEPRIFVDPVLPGAERNGRDLPERRGGVDLVERAELGVVARVDLREHDLANHHGRETRRPQASDQRRQVLGGEEGPKLAGARGA